MRFARPIARIVRIGAMLFLVLLGLVIAFQLVWFSLNLFDAKLTPASRALLAPPPDPLPDRDNIFFGFAGFDAPSGQTMMAVGEARIDAYNQAQERSAIDPAAEATYLRRTPGARLTFKGSMSSWQSLTSSIWSTAKTHRAELDPVMAANRELYQRYLALHGLRGYFDSARPGAFRPQAYVPFIVQELFLADVAARVQTGTPSQRRAALADLQQDIQMWKSELDGYGGPFSKVIAAVSLHADFVLLGDMVTDPDFDLAPLGDRWATLLAPFELQDWKIGVAYRWQMRETAPMFEAPARTDRPFFGADMFRAPWWRRVDERISAHFFKPNATQNLQAQKMERLRALADGDPGSFIERRNAYRAWKPRRFPGISSASWYNPVGQILLAFTPLEDDYPARVFDVAAFQRLVFLAYQIRLRCIAPQDVGTFMKQHPEWATHPIDARPFGWDPASGRLGLVPVGQDHPGSRFSLQQVGFAHCQRN